MKKRYAALIIAAAVLALGVYILLMLEHYNIISLKPQYKLSYFHSEHGTGVTPTGRMVAVSVFVSDDTMSWSDPDDEQKILTQLEYLSIAAQWMEGQAEVYGKQLDIIYDWQQDAALCYMPKLRSAALRFGGGQNNGHNYLWDFINNKIPSEELVEKYGADNIVYLVYFDCGADNSVAANAMDTYYKPESQYDMALLPLQYSGGAIKLTPTVVAHETLHLFGAPDLYSGGVTINQCGIAGGDVSYFRENYPDDIMLSTRDKETGTMFFDSIPRRVHELTAYYIGWLDEPPAIVDEFELHYSQHDSRRPSNEEGR